MGKTSPDVVYEDLCFDCQQAAEKSLKAFMVLNNLVPSATHSLSLLTETLEKNGIDIPGDVKGAVGLSYYAVTTRYPGHYEPIEEPEFLQALSMAKQVVAWVESRF
ncbi:MAG: HEPN domain-containing protein [Methanoregula sp.]|nr:HEPN domain-containing protein [Methanoregula sp.]